MKALAVLGMVLVTAPLAADTSWFVRALDRYAAAPGVLGAGWSPTGSAVVIAPVDAGGRGGLAARAVLFDAVDDRLGAEVEVWFDEIEGQDPTARPEVAAFVAACTRAAIRPLASAEPLARLPLVHRGLRFDARAEVTATSGPDEWGARALAYRLVAWQPRGTKTVATGTLAQAFEVGVAGAFPSPYEPRILLVTWFTTPGFEGERPRSYGFAGCHLTAGLAWPGSPRPQAEDLFRVFGP